MKKQFTFKKFFQKKERWLFVAIFSLMLVFGCYEFTSVNQPTEGYTNSSFDVSIVMKEDDDPTNDWTLEGGDLKKTGLFGILLPNGWTVENNIALQVEAHDSLPDGQGGWIYATSDHDGEYVIAYSESQTSDLNSATESLPPGYYWWGATSTEPVDMAFFDSLYFTVTILTDDQEGEFYLQYAVGDVDSENRIPYDKITDPLPITILPSTGTPKILSESMISVYPVPAYGYLNIGIERFNGDPVKLRMFDIRGKEVLNKEITNAQTTLDIVDLSAGTYVMRLETGKETITRRIVKN